MPIVIAAAYMLRLFQGTMQGPEARDLPQREDMTPLEISRSHRSSWRSCCSASTRAR
jgi:hypothetical protein